MKRFRSPSRWLIALSAVALALGLLATLLVGMTNRPALATHLPAIDDVLGQVRASQLSNHPSTHPPIQPPIWNSVRSRLSSLATTPSPEDVVQAAWRRAQEAGAYRFATDILQTTYPAPRVTNVGRSSRQDTLHIEGETNLPDRTMQMVLWQNGGSVLNRRDGVEMRIEGDQAYGRQTGGTWQKMDNVTDAFAPGNDLMAYLAGAKNVRLMGVETRALPPGPPPNTGRGETASSPPPKLGEGLGAGAVTFTRYAFDVDGPAFGRYLRDQLERYLIEHGELPAGLTLDVSNEYRSIIGDGEVWIDEAGLPLRLTVHLEYPQQPNGERIAADIKTDFSDFAPLQMARNQVLGKNLVSSLGQWSHTPADWQQPATQAGLMLGLMALMLLVVTHRQSRKVYAAVVMAIIFMMVVTPLLQSHQVYAFFDRQASRQAEQEQAQKEQAAVREWQEALLTSDWDPHRDPLENGKGKVEGGEWTENKGTREEGNKEIRKQANKGIRGSEREGLSSFFPFPPFPLPPSSLAAKDQPEPDSDDDSDGLTYLQETRLGTDPKKADSDGDGLRDDLEVKGFMLGGKRWYSDPLSPDTNNDGLLDTMECWGTLPDLTTASNKADSTTASNKACDLDTDGDGTPNLFDGDNDNDGVSDRVDLAPNKKLDGFGQSNPFKLVVDNLQKKSGSNGYPVFVDFQIRPANPDHLAYAMNVLDWPGGDKEGQVQRVKDNTFADLMNPKPPSDNANWNGDMRLVPMLEIKMPATSGTIPVLPLTTTKAIRQIEGWDGATRWISATVNFREVGYRTRLDFQFENTTSGVTVELYTGLCSSPGNREYKLENVSSGGSWDLAGRDVLTLVDGGHYIKLSKGDKSTCANLGDIPNGPYAGRMIDLEKLQTHGIAVRDADDKGNMVAYIPLNLVKDETGGGKAAFAGRMIYWPNDPTQWGSAHEVRVVWLVQMLDDAGNTNVVHSYPEEWTLTGLSVREDRGMDIAVAFEDPNTDNDLKADDRLWKLADGLQKTFTSPRDQNGNKIRDIGIVSARGGRTVADETISGRFDNQSNSYVSSEKLWGIPRNALRVKTYSYDHQDYLAKIPSEITPDILKTYFTSGGSARTDAPTLLFAREEHYRTAALDMVGGVIAISGSQVTVNMDRKKASLDTLASMNWGPYRYRNGQWEAYPLDEYWDKMAVRYKKIFQENPPKDEKGNRITDPDALEGLVIAAQSFYMAGVPGVNRVVESNYIGLITAKLSGYVADNSLAEASVNSVGAGIELVADQVAEEFFDTLRQQQEEVSEMFGNLFQEDKRGKFKVIRDLFKGKVKGLRLRNIRAAWRASRLKTAGKAAGTGLAVAALGFSIAASFSGDPIVKNITFGLAVVSTGVDLAVTIQGIAKATKGVVGFANKMAAAGREISDSAKKAGAILTVIAIAVTIGLFVAQWAMGAIGTANSLRFSAALAGMIATIIATVIMFAISLIPIVGQIIAALVALTDAVINLICGITDSEADICKGISGYLTQAIQWTIWSQTTLVGNLGDKDRMFVKDFKPALVDVGRGYSAGSQVRYSAKVGTAITLSDVPIDWKAAIYAWQYNYANLDSATFRYALQVEKKDIKGVERDQMEEDWKLPDGRRPGTFENLPDDNDKLYMTPLSVSEVITLTEAGINRPATLYLAEQYAVPTQECWVIPTPPTGLPLIPICYLRTDDNEGKSTHSDLGKNIKWDVFPATLDKFYDCESGDPGHACNKDGGFSLAWGQTGDIKFPRMKDFDGDGLLNKADGGNDPNDSKWDSDNDGLSDPFEMQKGSDPTLADSDYDGLSDYEEVRLGTNPNRQDSDGDGLTDKQELDGWEFVYALTDNGSQLKTWVTSDPLSVDTDNDTLTDYQEKTFGFHPGVATDPNLLDYESKVRETDAPVMLLRFEETDGAATFSDVSGDTNNGTCAGSACPAAGHSGRYSNALVFDGSDDYVNAGSGINLANQSFTVAFWAKRDATGGRNMFVIGQGTDSSYRALQLGFRDNNRFTCAFYGDDLDTSAAYSDQNWHHWACTYDASTRRRTIHRDGVQVAQDTASSHYQGSGDLLIGKAPWGDYFSGRLDEVAVFRTALSQSEIQAAMDARYNLNDMIAKPGQTLTYEGTVENRLFNRYTNGLLTTDFPGRLENNVPPTSFILQPTEKQTMSGNFTIKSDATSAISVTLTQVAGGIVVDRREESGYAELWLPFNEGSGWLLFSDLSGNVPARNATCFATSTGSSCPQAGQDGVIGRAVRFDGGDDYVRTTTPIDLANKSFTVAFWAKRSGATQQRNMFVVGQGADQVNQGLHLGFRNDNSFTCAFYGNDLTTATTYWTEDVWYHFACTYDVATRQRTIYVNGVKSTQDTPSAHYGGSGNLVVGGAPWGSYFYGAVDDVRVYARSLPAEEIASLAGRPAYETDLSGKSFDGKTYTTRMDRALDLSGGQFTFSAWIDPQRSGDSWYDSRWRGVWGSQFEESGAYPSLAIKYGSDLRFGFGDGSTWVERITQDAVTLNAWNHVVATFDGTTYRLYVNGVKKDETSDPFSGRKPNKDNTTLMIGRANNKGTVYLDDLQITDEGDGSGNAELCIAWRNSRGGDQRGIWSNDDVDVGKYDVRKSLDFWDEGYLRIWEDDGGTYCGNDEDDGDDYVWDQHFSTNDPSFPPTQYPFSETDDTEGSITLGDHPIPGFKNPSIPFYGKIGKFAIYKRAISSEEVKTLYEAESLALRLPFDEPPGVGLSSQNFANVADPTGQGRGTCLGDSCPTSGISGHVNQAALFDGRNDYVDVGSGIDLANQSFTLSAWAKRSSTGTYDLIIGQGSGDTNLGLQFGFRDINLFTCAFWGDDLNTTETYIDQKWHQWTCTYDAATRTRTIYRDGEQVKQDTASAHYQGSGDMTIGRFPNRSGFEFDGLLDDVRVYRKALSAGEARALYQSAPGLSLHFDEPEGASTFFDGSDRGHNGSCSWYSCPEAGVEGQMGRAAEFNGYNDVVQLTDAGTLGLKDSSFTVMAWVRGDSFAENGDNSILGTDEESKNNGLHLVVRNGKPYMGFRGNDTAGTTELKPDVWYHLVWRYNKDKGEQAIFVNGSLDTAKTGHGSFQGNGTVYVGRALGGRYFGGRIDELAIYQRALRDKEIRDIFLYQGKWIEESKPHPITIDADPPTSSLRSYNAAGDNYRANRDVMLDIQASDATSKAALAELGIKKDGQSSFTWIAAPECQDTEKTAWCPTFDPADFGGEGTYTLQTRATDAVGNRETPGTSYTLYVDNTPPVATADIVNGVVLSLQRSSTQQNIWILPLSGAINDPNLSSGAPGSGPATMNVTLLDAAGTAAGAGTQPAFVIADVQGQWSYSLDYVFHDANPTGVYTLTAEVADRMGNRTTQDLVTFQIDATAPGAELDPGISSSEVITGTATLGCGATNIALNRPATASSTEVSGFEPGKAVDGDLATRWSSDHSDPQWIQIDLGSVQSICRAVLRWETAYGEAYQIQVSDDAANWTTLYSTTSGDGGVDDLTGLSGSGRYIRMYGTARGTGWGYSLYEFEVYGSELIGGPTLRGLVSDLPNLPGALLRLHLEEAAGATAFGDSSGRGNNGTCSGSALLQSSGQACPTAGQTGKFGSAVQFDGADSITLANSLDFARADYTVAAWFKLALSEVEVTGATTAQTLFAAISGGNPGIRLELGSDGKSRYLHRFPAGGSGGTEIVSRRAYNDNTWHHLAAVKSGGSLTLYVDGVTVGAANDGSAPNYALNVALGQNFNGLLDEVQVYNRALTVSDIRSLAQDKVSGVKQVEVAFTPIGSDSTFNEPPEGQLLHLPLDDSPDKDGNLKFQDLSGNKHDGACSGDDCPTTGIPGHSGSAARFDNNDRISVPLDTPQGPFTLAAWVKFTGSDMTDRTIMEFGDGALRLRADGGKFNLYSTATQPVRSCRTYVSSDTPVPIHGGFPYGLSTSTIDVPDGFIVDDVNLTLNINYTVDSELSTYLEAPNGTSVSLFRGLGGDGDNFTNTVLDDEATQAITAGAPPFTGRFKPQSALSAVDGQSSQGAWQLGVLTQGIIFGTGALQSWLLQLCGTFVPPSNVISGGAVSAGQWAHVAYTWDGIYSRLYVNGVLVTSNTAPPRPDGKGLVIGKRTGQGWQGLIDDVRVFNRALEADEILRTTGPLLVLPFDEAWATDGATLADTSGWERQATLHSPRDWPANKNKAVNGQVGAYALQFDGYYDHVNAGSGIDLAGKSFTVAFWARRDAIGGTLDRFIIRQGSGTDYSRSLGIGFRANDKFTCAFLYNDLDTPTAYPDTDWHHWACTYDAGTNKRTIYRDGIQVAQDTAQADYAGSGELIIGNPDYPADFRGVLDDVRIYPRALSALEIQALAQSGWRTATYPAQAVAQSAQHTAAPATAPGCRTYSSSDTPVAINDNQTATSRITVPDDFTVDDVNLTLNINHTWDSDLLGYLIAPDGAQVVLFNRIGGSGDDFTNTTLDDEANEIIPGYGAPYSGNYRPQSPLSAVDGQSSLGTWQFKVSDNAWGDQGTIQNWQLELCSTTPPSPPFDWSYDVPAGLEGNYRIDLRGTDRAGLLDNSNNSRDLWRGIVDTLAPRVSITREAVGSKYRYTTVARDLNLGEQGFLSPCGAGVVKDRAYVDRGAGSGPQLIRLTAICDLGSTSTVAEVGAYDTPGYAYDVAVSGDPSAGSGQAYAYVADGARGLRVVDISNPSSPREVGAYDTPGSANGVAVSGDPSAGSGQAYAYVTWESTDDFWSGGGLRVVDISNPASPRQVGAYDVPAGNPKDVAVSGGYAYVAWEPGDPWGFGGGGNGGLYVLDVSNPAGPHQVGTYDTPGGANSVAVSGDPSAGSGQAYAYVTWAADWWTSSGSGLHIVDISNPPSPRQVGAYSTPENATSVAVSGDPSAGSGQAYAYVIWSDPRSFFPGSGGSGLRVVDISNPASPRQVGAYDIPEKSSSDVAVSGTYVYVTEGDSTFGLSEDGGLWVVDVSDPANPRQVGHYSTPGGNAMAVVASGNYAYIADGQKGLRVAQSALGGTADAEAATACDVFGQCATATLPPATRAATLATQATQVEPSTQVFILGAPPLLKSTAPITLTGVAAAPDYLRALTVTVSSSGAPLYTQSWASGTVTRTLFQIPWTPAGEGEHVFTAQASDWLTGTATYSTTIIVDTTPPAISIATDVLTSTHYATSGHLDITGLVTDTGGVESVDVDLTGFGNLSGLVDGNTWIATWNTDISAPPDNVSYAVVATATDVAGRTTTVSKTITVDVAAPEPVELSVFSDQLSVISPTMTIREVAPTLTLTWTQSSSKDLAGYRAGWVAQTSGFTQTTETWRSFASDATRNTQYVAGEAQKLDIRLAGQDALGNQAWQSFGPIYIDSPLTPDYVTLPSPSVGGGAGGGGLYHGWIDSGCSLIGTDNRIRDKAQKGAALDDAQQLYASWDTRGLRLAWTGADWGTDGDLFIYLDTQAGGSTRAYNPYTATVSNTIILLPPVNTQQTSRITNHASLGGMSHRALLRANATAQADSRMAADYLIWVRDSQTATLLQWNATYEEWQAVAGDWGYAFDPASDAPTTDFYVPFSLLGIGDPGNASLSLVAFATEGDALRLWATMPARNPVNSPRVLDAVITTGVQQFPLTHSYTWPSLGAGICVNGQTSESLISNLQSLLSNLQSPISTLQSPISKYTGADVRLSLNGDPPGIAYSVLGDNLFFAMSKLEQFAGSADWDAILAELCTSNPDAPECEREVDAGSPGRTQRSATGDPLPSKRWLARYNLIPGPPGYDAVPRMALALQGGETDFNAQDGLGTLMDVDNPALGNGDEITFTLRYVNRGTGPATGLYADIVTWGPMRLPGGTPLSDDQGDYDWLLLPLGDLAAGEEKTITFRGRVDLSYDPGNRNGWATIDVVIYDDTGSVYDNQLDWLYVDYEYDDKPPAVGVTALPALLGPGENSVQGFAFDQSAVPTITLETVGQVGNLSYTCPDDTPDNGTWSCGWDVSGAGEGDVFNLRAKGTDVHGTTTPAWTNWQAFTVDATPPAISFDAVTEDALSDGLLSAGETTLSGQLTDNRLVDRVEALDSGGAPAAVAADLLVDATTLPQTAYTYDDVPDNPIPIDARRACYGGTEIFRTFTVSDAFTVADVDLGLNADHEYRYDVTGWLVAPSGTWAAVLWDGTSADNYDVRLNDAGLVRNGKDKMDQDTGAPYYENERRPDQPLSVFSGEPAAGEWQLILCDYFPEEDDGVYNRSQLILTADTLPANTRGAWTYELPDVVGSDNVTRSVTLYGLDSVGNRSTEPLSLTFRVDTVGPAITVTTAITEVLLGQTATVLSGTVSDAGQVNSMFVTLQGPAGTLSTEQVNTPDFRSLADFGSLQAWQYDLPAGQAGRYSLWVTAVDEAGNTSTVGPFSLDVTCTAATPLPTAVRAEPSATAPFTVTLTAVISHTGATLAAGLPVAFYADGELIGTAATTRALADGEEEPLSVLWDPGFAGDYEITVIANDDGAGNRPAALCSAPAEAQQTVSILDVRLAEGWNLISSSVEPFTTDVGVVQRPIAGHYRVIRSFDGSALSYYPDLPAEVNTLQTMDAEHGYWIETVGSGQWAVGSGQAAGGSAADDGDGEVEPAAVLRVVGEKFTEDRPIELEAGWNLVSYLPRQALTVTEALQSIEGHYTAVLGFEQGALSYYPDANPIFNTLHTMQPQHGYWIKMSQAGSLQYPTTGDFRFSIADLRLAGNVIANRKSQIANPTNAWVNVYGAARTSDGTLWPVGTTVQALDPDGVVCGAAVIHTPGYYGLLACYGDDPTTDEDEGAWPGDVIRLVVDGQTLGRGTWTGHGERQWVPLGLLNQPTPGPVGTPTPTPAPTATPISAATPTPVAIELPPTATPAPPPAPPAETGSLTARVFIDYRCDRFFQDGLDVPLEGVSVTLSLADGTRTVQPTTAQGWVNFAGFDASAGVVASVELPASYRAQPLRSCANSPNRVQLEAGDFEFGQASVQFGAERLSQPAPTPPAPTATPAEISLPPTATPARTH